MVGGGFDQGNNGEKEYPGNLTPHVTVSCVIAAMGGLIFGYDIGVSGGVTSMDPFLKKFFPSVYRKQMDNSSTNQYCQFESHTLAMFTSSLYLAALVSSVVAATVTRRLGRKRSMLFGGVLFCAGALINGFAQAVWMLIMGRILLGFGVGFANQSVPLYLSEMAPYKHRGALNIGFIFILIAICIAVKFGVDGEPGELPKWYVIAVVVFICIYVAGYAWSWGPLGWLVPSEIFPLEIRSAAQSLSVSVNMGCTFVVTQIFLTMLCRLKFGLFLFFGFFVVVMTIFIYLFLPETGNIPIEEMDIQLSFARVLQHY